MTERAFAQPGEDGLVFIGPRGTALRRNNFRRRTWLTASDERQRQIAAALGELAAGDERKPGAFKIVRPSTRTWSSVTDRHGSALLDT